MKGVLPIAAIIGIIVAILIVAGAVYWLSTSHGTSSKYTTTAGSGYTTTALSNGSSSGQYGGGPGQWIMSKSEISGLTASGGAYNSSGTINSTMLAYYSDLYVSNQSGYFAHNVTGFWFMAYDLNGTKNNNASVIEWVFSSPNAKSLYTKEVRNNTSEYNVTNATVDGLTYSYEGLNESINGYYLRETVLVGYKDQGIAYVLDAGGYIPRTQLATTVAGDIP